MDSRLIKQCKSILRYTGRLCFLLLMFAYSAAASAQTFNTIQFVIGTGDANLRADSVATATLKAANGAVLQTVTLYGGHGSGWPKNSSETVTATLSRALQASQISQIVITQIEHNNFPETDNNWNVNSVKITLSNNGAGTQQLVNASGNPLKRLTGSDTSLALTPPAPPPPGSFNTVQFVIGTGDGDLRADCAATATLKAPNGAALQTITLYDGHGSGWANNSTNTVTAPLNAPLRPSDIGQIVVTQIEHNSPTETDNNWNVNNVVVTLSTIGGSSQTIVNASANPLQRLSGSTPSFSIAVPVQPPPGEFNTIQFAIATGASQLRADSVANVAIESANGAVLQTFTLYDGSGSGWPSNSTVAVTKLLNPALKPSDIGHIRITQVEHNNFPETDNNWNINNVSVSLSNVGSASQNVMSFTGNPLARLTGTQPSVTLPQIVAKAGLGMTMPVDPPSEIPDLNLNPSLPNGELPFGYRVPPAGFVDASSQLTGSCSSSWKGCLPAWHGTINEQDGRLNPFLRTNAASHDARLLLGRAVWLALGLNLPGSVQGMNCGGTNAQCSTALAQLAVTGREAFNSFIGWNPASAPDSSGPQVSDLELLVRTGHGDLPVAPSGVTPAQLQQACTQVLTDAYTALWAIRSNDAAWRQFRFNFGWIAVSGEDDAPHRPVNVFTAPFPQYDVNVPVKVGGRAFTLAARYMIASAQTLINVTASSTPVPAPAVPLTALSGACLAGNQCPQRRMTLPHDSPAALLNGQIFNQNVIVYIHGGGSRLEEGVPMATQFVKQFGSWSSNVVVISFDLPNSAYDDPMLTAENGQRVALDASSSSFEGGANGGSPSNVNSFPVLNFTLNFINNLLGTLDSQRIVNTHQVLALMGGSLGGNTSLLLGMKPLMPPFHLDNPIAFGAPASAPGGGQLTIVSWSPTSMVSYHDNAGAIVGGNMCCNQDLLNFSAGATWQAETSGTRVNYFHNLYFSNTSWFGGLAPDPEMWYRNDWNDAQGHSAATSFITQSRFDRYEIYSPLARLWTTAVDTEQAVFSFQNNTDASGQTYQPMYGFISPRLLLATGACDDYDNANSTSAFAPPPSISTGTCATHGIGHTGSNLLTHQDIYGFTHDVANDMRNATGKTLFLNDTGHSIHDERPIFFAQQIQQFLTTPDNNINITLLTGGDDLRWNSEVHALVSVETGRLTVANSNAATLDFPLNYWFHPWPAATSSLNNPCDACDKLTSFHLAKGSSSAAVLNDFTIALPSSVSPASISGFQLKFIPGTSSAGNTTDGWALVGVAACLSGKTGGFISDGFPPVGTIKTFNPSAANQPILWQPSSFQSPAISSRTNNCNPLATNPPPNSDVPGSIWNSGYIWSQ